MLTLFKTSKLYRITYFHNAKLVTVFAVNFFYVELKNDNFQKIIKNDMNVLVISKMQMSAFNNELSREPHVLYRENSM